MKDGGTALMGSATCSGSDRARKAAEEALASPLLDNVDIRGSKLSWPVSLVIRKITG